MNKEVTVIGAGRMASALARSFLQNGYLVRVWNRSPDKCIPLACLGAVVKPTPLEAIAESPVIVICLSTYDVVEGILGQDEVAAVLKGKQIVQLTSGSPSEARRLEAWSLEHGANYLDGAIMAPWQEIGTPGCPIIYSGAQAGFEANRELLQVLGGRPHYAGADAGSASTLDTALLIQMWGAMFGALQGAAICAAGNIPMDVFSSLIDAFNPAVDGGVKDLLTRISERRFVSDEDTLATMETHAFALENVIKIGNESGINNVIPIAFGSMIEKFLKTGNSSDDFSALFNLMFANGGDKSA